jgi:hypothetical protein
MMLTTFLLQDEAARGRERTCQDPNNLTPQARASTSLTHPYSSNMITETALHREVLNIYYTASARTKPWYDYGRFWEGTNEENWIIRWCLWHVFRYRDERNRHRGQGGPFYFFQEKEGVTDGSYNVKYMSECLGSISNEQLLTRPESMVPQEYKGYKIRSPSIPSIQMADYMGGNASDGSEPPSEGQSDRLSEPSLGGEDIRSNRSSMYYDPVRDSFNS